MQEAACSCGQLRVRAEGEPVRIRRVTAPPASARPAARSRCRPATRRSRCMLRAATRTTSARRRGRGADVPLLPRPRLDRLVPDRPGADRRPDRQLRRSELSAAARLGGNQAPASLGYPARKRGAQLAAELPRAAIRADFGSARAARPSPAARRASRASLQRSARAGVARRRAPSPSARSASQ